MFSGQDMKAQIHRPYPLEDLVPEFGYSISLSSIPHALTLWQVSQPDSEEEFHVA